MDADIYGPSVPIMFGLRGQRPLMASVDGKEMIIPIEKYGIKLMSIGLLVDEKSAVVWRGPMASSAIRQFVTDVCWEDLDYLIIDMPPGTGDIHLTLVQTVPVTGAVVVTTPQEVALADAKKAIAMFGQAQIKVPIIGLVENMAWFTPAELPTTNIIFSENRVEGKWQISMIFLSLEKFHWCSQFVKVVMKVFLLW
jgi:ATP-binding protein involved in chromosome partitioning